VLFLGLLPTGFTSRVEAILAIPKRPEVAKIQVTQTAIANFVVMTAFRDL
jgi:hypothetical protein